MTDRPFFKPSEAPRGVYHGDVSDLVYEIAPVPETPETRDYWIEQFRKELGAELQNLSDIVTCQPRVQVHLGGHVTCEVSVRTSASVQELCLVDDRVYNALSNVGASVDGGQRDLESKLDQVRNRRLKKWPGEGHYR